MVILVQSTDHGSSVLVVVLIVGLGVVLIVGLVVVLVVVLVVDLVVGLGVVIIVFRSSVRCSTAGSLLSGIPRPGAPG